MSSNLRLVGVGGGLGVEGITKVKGVPSRRVPLVCPPAVGSRGRGYYARAAIDVHGSLAGEGLGGEQRG